MLTTNNFDNDAIASLELMEPHIQHHANRDCPLIPCMTNQIHVLDPSIAYDQLFMCVLDTTTAYMLL